MGIVPLNKQLAKITVRSFVRSCVVSRVRCAGCSACHRPSRSSSRRFAKSITNPVTRRRRFVISSLVLFVCVFVSRGGWSANRLLRFPKTEPHSTRPTPIKLPPQ